MAGKFFDLDIQRELPGNLSNRDRYVNTSDTSDIQVGIEADTPPSEDNLSGIQIEQSTINIQTDISETIDTSLFYFGDQIAKGRSSARRRCLSLQEKYKLFL